jgi:hypothetical protein
VEIVKKRTDSIEARNDFSSQVTECGD